MPRVYGILETAVYVRDVSVATDFYRRLFGFDTLLDSERLAALSVAGRDVLLLFKQGATNDPYPTAGGVIPGHYGTGTTHFAFSITREDVQPWLERLKAEQVAVESIVEWPGDSKSIYFRDPDSHLVELITPGFWRIY